MKKTIAVLLIICCVLAFTINSSFATAENTTTDAITKQQGSKEENIIERNAINVTDKMAEKKAEFTEKYGSDAYWLAGYVIEDIVQPYSIPFCILGIIAGLVFQYVMGTRRLDYKHRGFGMVIVFVTILAICQVLPFIYALVLFGWRG